MKKDKTKATNIESNYYLLSTDLNVGMNVQNAPRGFESFYGRSPAHAAARNQTYILIDLIGDPRPTYPFNSFN